MNLDVRDDGGWRLLLKRLPGAKALMASAQASGALVRRRAVQTPMTLLRLALAYGPGGLSLRETSAWAEGVGVARLSDVALLKRLQRAAGWLGGLVGDLLAERAHLARGEQAPGRWLRLIDGTVVGGPGGRSQWRLHLTFDLSRHCLAHVELTDRRGAEKLERAPVERGEIRVGDRCYARPEGLLYMIRGGGDFVLRLGVRSLKLLQASGRPFGLPTFLRRAAKDGIAETTVLVGHGRRGTSWQPFPVRLIAVRKPPGAAASSRRAARRASQRQGNRISRQTLNAANYLLLVTSLDGATYPAALVIAIYRMRWQVELLAKRLKSLLHIDRLPAKQTQLARCWLYSHLLLALLVEDMTQEFLDSSPSGRRHRAARPLAVAPHQAPPPPRTRSHPHPRRTQQSAAQRRTLPLSSVRSDPPPNALRHTTVKLANMGFRRGDVMGDAANGHADRLRLTPAKAGS